MPGPSITCFFEKQHVEHGREHRDGGNQADDAEIAGEQAAELPDHQGDRVSERQKTLLDTEARMKELILPVSKAEGLSEGSVFFLSIPN